MAITAALVKELRERTSAGMMECKKALVETNGDIEAAIEHLRKTGLAKAGKKAGRIAAEGKIILQQNDNKAVLAEVNCETDFVTKEKDFESFAELVANRALTLGQSDVEALMADTSQGESLEDIRKALIAKIGENIQVRRISFIDTAEALGAYLHGTRIGVLLEATGNDNDLAKDLAMHVAASKPAYISIDNVPADEVAKEKEILIAQAQDTGKPAEIIEKMVQGRLNKHIGEITLLGQAFVKNPDQKVAQLLKEKGASVKQYVRFEVGEGIEKKEENFAEEVMAQVRGS